jgi:peptide-methionine (S)-S-oxide reductase
LAVVALFVFGSGNSEVAADSNSPISLPPPSESEEVAVLAGGCFWGVEGVFERLEGVRDVASGYSGGTAETASYYTVAGGKSDHAESVRIVYDPAVIDYSTLLEVFFTVAHDPTQLNFQGPDLGPQYRSAIFYADEEQREAAEAYIRKLGAAGKYRKPIVTQVVPLDEFYAAEEYHQDFMRLNPDYPYVVYWDKPKIEKLEKEFPHLIVEE